MVKEEVTDRQIRDQAEIDEVDQKGQFKIPVTMQMEQLMKLSKSIMDKTKADVEKEKQDEIEEVCLFCDRQHSKLAYIDPT